jgi:hypothetical protein
MNIMKKHSIFLILILLSLFLNGCKYDFILPEVVTPPDNGGQPISFAKQIVPIFASKCTLCHNTQAPIMTADVAYSQLVPNYVNTASPASSVLYVNATSGTHGGTVSATQAALILKWITEGANNTN